MTTLHHLLIEVNIDVKSYLFIKKNLWVKDCCNFVGLHNQNCVIIAVMSPPMSTSNLRPWTFGQFDGLV